jgi:Skp family chaperone for outer membrane proteins
MTHHDTPDALMLDRATGDAPRASADPGAPASEADRAAAAAHIALTADQRMPSALRARVLAEGEAVVSRSGAPGMAAAHPTVRQRVILPWVAAAACLAIAGAAVVYAVRTIDDRTRQLDARIAELETVRNRLEANDTLLAEARTRVDALTAALDDNTRALADAASRELALTQQLADATSTLTRAELRIAQLEAPADPTILQQNRRKLLEVPDTIRVAWAPFNLPDAVAELPDVTGDVVWNDGLQQGYLRFVGLPVNDPAIEQYQVWVIDERGMEQKVSGGVFNASADGEVIVPIDPGIAIGRVALFAVTIERPGGTWVPDLQRRVVIAPRGDS